MADASFHIGENMKMELLAPAGGIPAFKAVIAAGADAVYIGGAKFGARAYADNPDESELLEAIDYAHLRGVKVYLTVNTLLKNEEIKELIFFIRPYYLCGIDAVLVQDFGALKVLHEHFPDLPLHASTQMTLTGPSGAVLLKKYGVTRIVPARELSLKELKQIHNESGLEVETFVHGALCVCYSGQCLLSGMLGGRSGNRGRCAQPCRLTYSCEGAKGELLSPKDLCAVRLLPEISASGAASLKIEGRMKQPEYAAGVTAIYRKYLDLLESGRDYKVEKKDEEALSVLFSRDGFTDGYYRRHNGREMMAFGRSAPTPAEDSQRNALYEEIRRTYMEKEKLLEITGTVFIKKEEPLRLSLACGNIHAEVSGNIVQEAVNRPLTAERAEEQIQKTGGTGFIFKKLDCCADADAFVQMKDLNELRRNGMNALKEEILKDSRRTEGSICRETAYDDSPDTAAFSISASVETEEQFRTLLSVSGISLIYVSAALIMNSAENKKDSAEILGAAGCFMDKCRKYGKKMGIALPYIVRPESGKELTDLADELADAGIEVFLARSLESLAVLRAAGYSGLVRADEGLYTYNDAAEKFLDGLGIRKNTAPAELNKKELFSRYCGRSELIVFGYQPLMVSAQCLRRNISSCDHLSQVQQLTDRTGKNFPVKSECVFCYNVLYNSTVLSLLDEAGTIKRMGFSSVRLAFTLENAETVRETAELAVKNFIYGKNLKYSQPHTKGHFNRGVE